MGSSLYEMGGGLEGGDRGGRNRPKPDLGVESPPICRRVGMKNYPHLA